MLVSAIIPDDLNILPPTHPITTYEFKVWFLFWKTFTRKP